MENPLNLRHIRLTTRIIGAGLIPSMQVACRLADHHGYKINASPDDVHTYVELPDLGIDVHTIRHQTQVRTDLTLGSPAEAFTNTAWLIDRARLLSGPPIMLAQDISMGGVTQDDPAMRNEHPFDSGLSAVIITLENEVDDQTPFEEAPYTKREAFIFKSEMEREIYMGLNWQNMDKAMRCGEMEYVAEAVLRIRSGMPTGYYLTELYQEIAQQARARTLQPLHTAKMEEHLTAPDTA